MQLQNGVDMQEFSLPLAATMIELPSFLESPLVPDSTPPPITLDQFLKQMGIVGSGGQAKVLIQSGDVLLNGTVETRRGKKLSPGDIVSIFGEQIRVPDEQK